MTERQIFISFEELQEIEITCLCGTGLVISALSNAPKLKSECPGCGRSLSSAAQGVLGFREFYSKAKEFVELPKEDSNPVAALASRAVRFRVSDT
jgi:hypothetical protein